MVRKSFLPFHLPDIGRAEVRSVTETMLSGWITTGPKVKTFEAQFARAVGAPHAVAVNSCTAALHLALEAVGVRAGDEVVVPTLTFAATGEVVRYFGARPILVDSLPDTLNMDPEAVARAITRKTRAIIPVHFAGLPCDMDAILRIARKRGIFVIEDAAHAFPATWRGRPVGSLGDITCFSFYATKTITTGEGGMAVTKNEKWADRMRMMSLHGISKDAWKRYTAQGSWYYEILAPGYKYNMTDIAAAMGIEQIKKARRFLEARRRIARKYDQAFGNIPGLRLPPRDRGTGHAWHLYVLRIDPDRLGVTRDRFIDLMKEQNIGTSVHFIPLHRHPYYRKTFGCKPGDFPNADFLYSRTLSLPIYPRMSASDVRDVIRAVRSIAGADAR